ASGCCSFAMIVIPNGASSASATFVFGGMSAGSGMAVPPMLRLTICVEPVGTAVHELSDVEVTASACSWIGAATCSASTLVTCALAIDFGAEQSAPEPEVRTSAFATCGSPPPSTWAVAGAAAGGQELA